MLAVDLEPIVQIEKLSIRRRKAVAVEDVGLTVNPGSVYALLGRPGAGKTSIVRCLLGLEKPDTGRVRLFGENARRTPAISTGRIGVVPEDPDAPPDLPASEIGRFFRRFGPAWNPGEFDGLLARWGVPAETPFGALSKSRRALVALAAALAHGPELLVLDDPTLGLEEAAAREIRVDLAGRVAGARLTIVLATREAAGLESFADRVGILRRGRLVLDEGLETLRSRFRRIRYSNDRGAEGVQPGTELEDFFAERVRVRGWGVEALVSDFDEAKFQAFAKTPGVVDAEASAAPLEEIFAAVAGS